MRVSRMRLPYAVLSCASPPGLAPELAVKPRS
jgi:hypothetical protein